MAMTMTMQMMHRVFCLHWLLVVVLVSVAGQSLPLQLQLHYVVVENEPPPVTIGNLTADVLRYGIFQSLINDSAENYLFSFSCEQLPSALHGVTVDNGNGRLLSRSALDREALGTSGGGGAGINVLLAVRRRNASASERPFRLATLRVLINVSDVNDNAPVWTDYVHEENTVAIEFSENAQLGARQVISAATDADTGANSLISYAKSCSVVASNGASLCGSADPFYIKAVPPGAGEIVLVLNSSLDRENVGEYGFTITARDDGSPPLSSTLSLRVLVTDVNDNSPKFTETNYTVSLAENYPVNQAFQRVSAVDPDEGANGQVTYSIRWASLPDYVSIDQFTGELTLMKQLDYETAPTIDIRVQARDDDRPPKSSTSVVWINVLDINDATPFISVHECGDGTAPSIDIEEHRKPFSTSCRVAAYDDDAGPAGDVHCEVLGNEAAFFELELASTFASRNPSYFLRLKRELDREKAAQHEVRVQCTDHGSPPQSSSSQLLVHVADINDCTPKFTGPRLNESPSTTRLFADVRENSEPGTVIARLTANDCDDGVNARLEFQIANQTFEALPNGYLNEAPFAINAKTGEISVTSSKLDRELGQRFLLQLVVKDSGSPSLSTTAVLEVNVQDENDNPCVLTQRSYDYSIDENAVGVELGQIRAVDLDSGDNAKFSFYLEDTTGDSDRNRFRFHLDEDTGVLSNLIKLDREQEAVYLFTVRVFDRFRKYNDSAPLTIRVADTNDNRPEFLFPTPTNYNAHINYPLVKGDNITRVLAVDPDAAENGTMFYSVSEYQLAVARLFDINAETGQIYLRRDLEASDLKGHKLVVRVQDGGRTPLTNEGSVYIYLDKNAMPSYVRSEPGTSQLNNQQPSTPRSYFGGVSDALMLTVFLCAVFVCVIVLASVALLILFRRFKQQRRATRNHHEATKRGEAPKRDSMIIEGTQRIYVADKMGTLKQCVLSEPSRFLSAGASCFSTQQSPNQVCCSTTNAASDSQRSTHSSSSSCAHEDAASSNNFTTDLSENNNANNNNSAHKMTIRNQKQSVDKSTVAVIEKTYRESCTPVWKPRTLDKACVNPECVLCRSVTVSKSATMCVSPTTKRQSSSQSATIARDYSVGSGRRLTESQRVPRRKHVEIRSPATSPNSIRTIGDADFEVETQNSSNDQRAEHAEHETEQYSCGQNLLSNIGPSKSIFRAENVQRQREHNNVRLSPIDYVTAISVHLQSQETQAPAKSRSDTMKSFNKCPIDSASYV